MNLGTFYTSKSIGYAKHPLQNGLGNVRDCSVHARLPAKYPYFAGRHEVYCSNYSKFVKNDGNSYEAFPWTLPKN